MDPDKFDDQTQDDFTHGSEFPSESGRQPHRPKTNRRTPASWLRLGCAVFALWMMAGLVVCVYSMYSRIMSTVPQSSLAGHAFVLTARDLSRHQNHLVLRLRVKGENGRTTDLPPLQEDCINWKAWLSLRVDQRVWFCRENPALQIFTSGDLSRIVYPCAPDPPAPQ
jgi:hypothetical protein